MSWDRWEFRFPGESKLGLGDRGRSRRGARRGPQLRLQASEQRPTEENDVHTYIGARLGLQFFGSNLADLRLT